MYWQYTIMEMPLAQEYQEAWHAAVQRVQRVGYD